MNNKSVVNIEDTDEPTTRLLHRAIDQAFNAVVITDAGDGVTGHKIVYANSAFCRMTGYPLADLLGQNPRILQGPLTDRQVIDDLRACLQDGRMFRGSTINYRKDGSTYTVEWNMTPVRNAAGEVTHFVSTQQDIGHLVAAQKTSQLLATALDSSQDAVVVTDTNGRIEFVNQGFETLTGYSPAESVGHGPDLLPAESPDADRAVRETVSQGQTFRATVARRHKNGEFMHFDHTVSPVRDPRGRVTHFIGILKDLTERVQKERELLRAASVDPLTGLLNRRAGERHLKNAFVDCREGGKPFCAVLVDIDHFKSVNDTFGHSVGDVVLAGVARLLQASVRCTDGVVRWGGEEFLVILGHSGLEDAYSQAERIRARIGRTPQEKVGRVTVSIGVAEIRRDESLQSLLERADAALYTAKTEGRDRVCVAGELHHPVTAPALYAQAV